MANPSADTQKLATERDRQIGLRITALRKARGITQTAMGQAIGVTFQQVQKYEKGANRVGAGRLQEIAQLLGVPPSALFEEGADSPTSLLLDLIAHDGAAEVLHIYAALDPSARREALAMLRAFGRAVGAAASSVSAEA